MNLTPMEDRNSFDLFVKDINKSMIFEIKSLSKDNFVSQTRSAFVQLMEYSYTHKHIYKTEGFNGTIEKYLVFHDNPQKYTDLSKIEKYFLFAENLNINIIWLENGEINQSKYSVKPW